MAVGSSLPEPVAQTLHSMMVLGAGAGPPPPATWPGWCITPARAGDSGAVLRYAPEAARQAQQRGAHREAAAHWGTVLAHADMRASIADAERAGWLKLHARANAS